MLIVIVLMDKIPPSSSSYLYIWNQGSELYTWYIDNWELGSQYIGNWKDQGPNISLFRKAAELTDGLVQEVNLVQEFWGVGVM